jgi:hypothetical protein
MILERDLLAFWESGLNKSLIERSLLLVSLSHPAYEINQIAAMPIGKRDVHLLEIREKFFGPIFESTADCPKCSQKTEWEMNIDTLMALPSSSLDNQLSHSLEYNGNHIKFRLPNSTDIIEVMAPGKGISKEEELLRRCIEPDSLPSAFSHELPEDLISAIAQKIEVLDPQADMTIAISCPECGHNWEMTFDIMSYLWAELDDWATNLMHDIYLLAKNFGWSENDILEMGSFRRGLYIKMVYA